MSNQAAKEVVERYFEAMRAGPAGEDALLRLFADDAVYIEPFAGTTREHRGIDEIRSTFQASWAYAPPDLQLTVERIDLDANQVRSTWICNSPAFPAPVRGHDLYEVRNGLIARLEVTLEPPVESKTS